MRSKIYNLEDRLVAFAADVIQFCKTLPGDLTAKYYTDQLLRSTGSAALHYGEAQGTTTDRDFVNKMSGVLKELRETLVSLKILNKVEFGDADFRTQLINESIELSAISAKMILNKKKKN